MNSLYQREYMRKWRKRFPEYGVWQNMKTRCSNPNVPVFKYYGGRGIKVCEKWVNSFENFIEDMGHRPSSKHTIERFDNNGDYEPENCGWVTMTEQLNNRRFNHNITFQDETLTMSEWARKLSVSFNLLNNRLNRDNWSIERALTQKRRILNRKRG